MKLSAILLAASICMMPSVGTQAKSKKKDKKNATAAMQQSPAAGSYAKLTSGSKKQTGLFTVLHNAKTGQLMSNCPTRYSLSSLSLPTVWRRQATPRTSWQDR